MERRTVILLLLGFVFGIWCSLAPMISACIGSFLLIFAFIKGSDITEKEESAIKIIFVGYGIFLGSLVAYFYWGIFFKVWVVRFLFISVPFFASAGTVLLTDKKELSGEGKLTNEKKKVFQFPIFFLFGFLLTFFGIIISYGIWATVFIIGLVFVRVVKTNGIPIFLAVLATALGIFLGSLPLVALLMPRGLYTLSTELGYGFIAPSLFLCGVGLSVLWSLTKEPLGEIKIWG